MITRGLAVLKNRDLNGSSFDDKTFLLMEEYVFSVEGEGASESSVQV